MGAWVGGDLSACEEGWGEVWVSGDAREAVLLSSSAGARRRAGARAARQLRIRRGEEMAELLPATVDKPGQSACNMPHLTPLFEIA